MAKERKTFPFGVFVLVAVFLIAALPSWAADMPRSFGLGTNPQGSLYYAAGSAAAKVLSENLPVPVRVQPHAGSSTFLPLIDSGELQLGVNNSNDVRMAYRGLKPFLPTPNLRLASTLFVLRVAPLVRADSGIRSLQDIRGKRVAGEYSAHLAVWYNSTSMMANAGLKWEDVKMVPTANVVTGCQALIEGRVDVAWFAVGAAKTREANAAISGGIRFLAIDPSPEAVKRMQDVMGGTYATLMKKGSAPGVLEDIYVQAYDTYIATGAKISDPAVAAVVKALYKAEKAIQDSFRPLRDFSRDKMAKENATIPFHRGAISAYKELGLWNARMDAVQAKLLSEAAK
ncbi:MAG: TAXI family TRAP transporter solute-binding subunit [Pseudomonadota bacterium]